MAIKHNFKFDYIKQSNFFTNRVFFNVTFYNNVFNLLYVNHYMARISKLQSKFAS